MSIEITAVCNAYSLEDLAKQLNKKIKEGFIAAGTPILADGEYFQSILRISVCKQHKFDKDAYEFQKKMYEINEEENMNKEREPEAFIKLENSNLDELKRIMAVLKSRGYEAEGDIDLSELTFMYSQNMVKYKPNELNNEFSHKYTLKQVKELKDMHKMKLTIKIDKDIILTSLFEEAESIALDIREHFYMLFINSFKSTENKTNFLNCDLKSLSDRVNLSIEKLKKNQEKMKTIIDLCSSTDLQEDLTVTIELPSE